MQKDIVLALVGAFVLILPATQYTLATSAFDYVPYVQTLGIEMLNFGHPSDFTALFKVNAVEKNLKDIKILISSDIETIQKNVSYIEAYGFDLVKVRIKASDPSSINAKIIDYQIKD